MIDIICFENIKLSLDKYVTCENDRHKKIDSLY